MKSSPLSNRRTANPPEASKTPVDIRTRHSSSTVQTISAERSSVGITDLSDLRAGDLRGRISFPTRRASDRLPRYSAQSRHNFQAGHSFHPNVQHHQRDVV